MSLFRFLSVSAFITSLTVAIKKLNVICLSQRFKTLENWNILVKRQRTIIIILLPCRKNLKTSGWTSVTIDTCVLNSSGWNEQTTLRRSFIQFHNIRFYQNKYKMEFKSLKWVNKILGKKIVIFRLKNNKKRLSHMRQDKWI